MFGCVELRGLRQQVDGFSAGFDAAVLSPAQAAMVVKDAAAIEKMAATIKAFAAARCAETNRWGAEGEASAAHDLAKRTGTTVGRAKDAIRTAQRLAELPELDAAARRGEVSPEQAAAISEAAVADPAAQSRLLAKAKHASLGELRQECERTKAAVDHDAEARHRRIHGARFARRRHGGDGSAEIVYRSTRDEVATVWAVVRGFANAAFDTARTQGRHEPADAYAADGLLAMATAAAASTTPAPPPAPMVSPTTAPEASPEPAPAPHSDEKNNNNKNRSPVPTRIVVRIDWDALVRGYPISEETCEIAGVGSVPVSVVRAMMQTGDPFLAAVVTKGVDVVNVAHLGRRPSAYQQSAMEWISPTCTAQGCDRLFDLQYDHRQDWADTKITLLTNLDHPCGYHHDRKTYDGWAFVEGTGKRPMVPPEDPRHPRYQPQQDLEWPA